MTRPPAGTDATRLTEEQKQKILGALRTCAHRSTACKFAGVPWHRFSTAVQAGKKGKNEACVAFYKAVREAESTTEIALVGSVAASAKKDPKTAMELLGRRFPKRWSKQNRLEISGPNGKPIQIEIDRQTTMKSLHDPRLCRLIDYVLDKMGIGHTKMYEALLDANRCQPQQGALPPMSDADLDDVLAEIDDDGEELDQEAAEKPVDGDGESGLEAVA